VTGQRSRADVQPLSWEIPTAGMLGWLTVAVLVLPAGQGGAGWLRSRRFAWPRGTSSLGQCVSGLLSGHLGRGLSHDAAAQLASPALTYGLIAAAELLLLVGTGWAVLAWWRYLGPGALQGMATRSEAEAVLGLVSLRRKRAVIRPDRYRRARGESLAGGSGDPEDGAP
jgi:hypothetical protein